MELADERRDRDDRTGPEARWDALGATCEPMDKLMRLVGLSEVKDRAISVSFALFFFSKLWLC